MVAMNKNDDLVSKCLDTLEPKWSAAIVAVSTKDGIEFELFSKTGEIHEQVVLLSSVSAASIVEIDRLLERN